MSCLFDIKIIYGSLQTLVYFKVGYIGVGEPASLNIEKKGFKDERSN